LSTPNFKVEITQKETLNEIEGAWTDSDFLTLLDEMEFSAQGVTTTSELRELCLMCLQDRPPVEAAELVLKHRLNAKLTAGQIKNAAIDLPGEKLWEQFADLTAHEELFHVGSLMFAAFPDVYFEPDAIRLSLKIESTNRPAEEILTQPLNESMLVRLLADGMGHSSILHRLFDDQLAGSHFPEASSIVWDYELVGKEATGVTVTIISSAHWLDSLDNVREYQSHATPDSDSENF